MRKLSTIRYISNIKQITNADRIEVAVIDGWECIVGKDQFKVTEKILFIEPDALVPKDIKEFEFLDKYCKTKKVNDKEYYLISTTKLRGQISQGVVIKLDDVKGFFDINDIETKTQDVSEYFKIIKYEPSEVDGGNTPKSFLPFPYFIRKTDEERIQNLDYIPRFTYEITEKLDGTSCTIYHYNGKTGVCSRNRELKVEELPKNDVYLNCYNKIYKIFKMERFHNNYMNTNIALQGEIVGPKIQKNPYKLEYQDFYVFNIFNIDTQEYMNPNDVYWFCKDFNLNHVPIIKNNFQYNELMDNLDLYEYSYGNSILNPKVKREGVVFKSVSEDTFSFKIINLDYLLKKK